MKVERLKNPPSPLELFERLFKDKPFCFFLDSGMDHEKLGRFSFMGAEPFLIMKSKGRLVEIVEIVRSQGHQSQVTSQQVKRFIGNPFLVLKELLKKYSNDFYLDDIPFSGGALGYFSYDLCHFIEKLPSTAIDDIDLPDCWVGFYDDIIAIDHQKNKTYRILNTDINKSHCERLRGEAEAGAKPALPTGLPTGPAGRQSQPCNIKSNFLKEGYIAAINRAKEYIKEGDIYQVNLSQRFETDLAIPPFELYKRLRGINPAPFAAYLDFGEAKIISASPERFLKVDAKSRHIETRPIKGTRPRGTSPLEDERFKQELINSAKDRAEHIMIVDLERNDLGRVCDYGSVKPTEFITLEKYSTVFHLVSTVRGTLRNGVDAADCLLNCFPGGSITGAPKIRSMEIIDELEPTKRSIYTGAMGYIGFNGNMDTNIVIRSFIAKGDKLYFQFGGGIVADSDPEAEYQETLYKAKALMEAIGTTEDAKVMLKAGIRKSGNQDGGYQAIRALGKL